MGPSKSKIMGIASDTAANQIAANRIIKEQLVSDGIDLRSYRCTMHLIRNRMIKPLFIQPVSYKYIFGN